MRPCHDTQGTGTTPHTRTRYLFVWGKYPDDRVNIGVCPVPVTLRCGNGFGYSIHITARDSCEFSKTSMQ